MKLGVMLFHFQEVALREATEGGAEGCRYSGGLGTSFSIR